MKSRTVLYSLVVVSAIGALSAVKVDVCHNVDNNPHTINIALPAAMAHLMQHEGDTLGSCDDIPNEEEPSK
ncbi:MAG TPA: hypothetical protein VKZ97_00755 [Flavobacteriaceae bacterium]|nr:hypothetical protein [Flavobacteriaceae bacterium]